MLTPYQMLLMQATGRGMQGQPPQPDQQPQQPQPQPQAPAPSAPQGPTRVDRLLRNYDRFALAGADPQAVSPQERSFARRALLMQIGGALASKQPIAAGVNAHMTAQAARAQAQEAARRQQMLTEILGGGGQPTAMPMPGAGGAGADVNGQRAVMLNRYQQLLSAGLFEDAAKLSEQINRLYPDETFTDAAIMRDPETGELVQVRQGNRGSMQRLDYDPAIKGTQANLIDRVALLNPYDGSEISSAPTGMTPYQRARLDQQERKLAREEAGGGFEPGVSSPETRWDEGTQTLWYRKGDQWAVVPGAAARIDKARKGVSASRELVADMQRLRGKATEIANADALSRVSGPVGVLPDIPGGPASRVRSDLERLRAEVSVAALQRMRSMSATGGAVGQVTEKEWPRLEAALANLDAAQGHVQLRERLNDLAKLMDEITTRVEQAANEQFSPILAPTFGGQRPEIKFERWQPKSQGQSNNVWRIERAQ